LQGRAYGDHALPISGSQTISQPYIVARMTELLEINSDSRVLEIGAGSGYQTAILAKVAGQVYSIERIASLAREAQSRIRQLNIYNATVKCFDGTLGLGGKRSVRCDPGGGWWPNNSRTAGGAAKSWRPIGGARR
jgi:protein-L-isoaspartate(D-aspartate) O-methyltransferase